MGVATSFTSDRMFDIEQNAVVAGLVDLNGDLILEKKSGSTFNAGHVKGDTGPEGPDGAPAGSILAWPAMGIPENWLECNGQAVSRTIYSDLFAIIGSIFGSGDGVNTFNVPDLRGRVIAGYDNAQPEFNDLAKIGGEKKHLLTVAELPSHTHIQQAHSHNSNGGWGAGSYDGGRFRVDANSPANRWGSVTSTTAVNLPEGGDVPHNNLQPYAVSKYIIKASGGVGVLNSTVESALLGRTATLEAQVYSKLPAFKAIISEVRSFSGAATWRKINFNVELLDTVGCYDPSLGRFVAPIDGLYEFDGHVTFSTTSGGPALAFYINGAIASSSNKNGVGQHLGYNNAYDGMHWSEIFELVAGDYVEVYHNNANGQAVSLTNTYGTSFQGKLLQAS